MKREPELPHLPRDNQERERFIAGNLIFHFRPRTIPKRVLRFTHTWGLGGMSLVLVLVLFLSGIMLKFVYEPFPGGAYDSIVALQDEILFGRLIRNIHHWSANILVLMVFLHMLRVFFSKGFQPPRQFNWLIGLLLFTGCLAANFTGYLLPWDQLAYWAITICTAMLEYVPLIGNWLSETVRGGAEIGSTSLLVFYTLHTAIFPGCFIVLLSFHFWRIRKAGGIVLPPPDEGKTETELEVSIIPNLLLRELVVALILVAFIMLLAVIFDAPLGDRANPGLSPNPAKAPWYFAGIQELLLLLHPLFAILLVPLFVAGFLVFLPYFKYDSEESGKRFHSRRGRKMAVVSLLIAVVATIGGILANEALTQATTVPGIISNGFIPVILVLVGIVVYGKLLKKRFGASNNEIVQAYFVLLVVSYVILTLTGVWLRGEGMALAWP